MRAASSDLSVFQQTVWHHYELSGRHDMAWRQPLSGGSFDPYRIIVSEIMLQQTQVQRVLPKYHQFISAFPSFKALAEVVHLQYAGVLPQAREALLTLPGIGPATAGSIMVYAFNQPVPFIETNVRTVFIYHFFAGHNAPVTDKELHPLVEAAIPSGRAREWYWALMDYGWHLKRTVGNVSRQSNTYVKQSTFEGSRRQLRGQVLRHLSKGPHTTESLFAKVGDERLADVVDDLVNEGFIVRKQKRLQLAA